jgi:hypothetical protein
MSSVMLFWAVGGSRLSLGVSSKIIETAFVVVVDGDDDCDDVLEVADDEVIADGFCTVDDEGVIGG